MNISGVGTMGVGEMGQIVGEMGIGETGTSRKMNRMQIPSYKTHL